MLQIIFQTIEKQVFKKNTQSNDFMPPFSYASKRTILLAIIYLINGYFLTISPIYYSTAASGTTSAGTASTGVSSAGAGA